MKYYKTLFPITHLEYMGRNVDSWLKHSRKIIRNSFLPKEQKHFLETLINMNAGSYYLGENILTSYEEQIGARQTLVPNFLKRVLEGKIDLSTIKEIIDFGIKHEIDLFKSNNEAFGKVGTDYQKQFIDALKSDDKKALLKMSRHLIDDQYWIKKGPARLGVNIEQQYGLEISSEIIYSTNCFELTRIDPIYGPGEKASDFKRTEENVIWIVPALLGKEILSLLPNHGMSLVHYLAKFHNVYVISYKNYKGKALLEATSEKLLNDIHEILQFMYLSTGLKSILAGYCQGGTIALMGSLTEKINQLIKGVVTAMAPTDIYDTENIGPMIMALEDLDLVGKYTENGHLMIDKNCLFLGLKKKGQGNGSEFLASQIKAKKYRERIKELIAEGRDVGEAIKCLSEEIIYDLAIENWTKSKKSVPPAAVEITLELFAKGISDDGLYSKWLYGKQLDLNYLVETNTPSYFIYGKHDKVVKKETATAAGKRLSNSTLIELDCGHIGPPTEFGIGFQEPFIKAVEEISKKAA